MIRKQKLRICDLEVSDQRYPEWVPVGFSAICIEHANNILWRALEDGVASLNEDIDTIWEKALNYHFGYFGI